MLPPSFTTALHSLDFGDVTSPDGRAHPLTALTPITIGPRSITDDQQQLVSDSGAPVQEASFPHIPNPFSLPPHFGIRTIVVVIAIVLILIVGLRLTR